MFLVFGILGLVFWAWFLEFGAWSFLPGKQYKPADGESWFSNFWDKRPLISLLNTGDMLVLQLI
jgi:hypothetical protein